MKAQIIGTNHTVMIEEIQIDLWYNFKDSTLTAFIDGHQTLHCTYTPSHQTFNYINILQVCTTLLEHHKRKESQEFN